jgi:hypothetical protein
MITNLKITTEEEARTDNTGLAKVAVQCSAYTFVVNQSLVLRINICAKNKLLRQSAKRYGQLNKVEIKKQIKTKYS